jgi:hypothetical protein
MANDAGTNTGAQGGAPALPNNFQGKKPADDRAPRIGGKGFTPQVNDHNRGKDGTAK